MKFGKISAAVLAAALMTGTAVTAFAEDKIVSVVDEDGIGYRLINDNVAVYPPLGLPRYTVSPVEEKKSELVDVVVPAELDISGNYLSINGFNDCANLKSVTIRAKYDPKDAEGFTGLYCVEANAFANCPNLTDIYFSAPKALVYINEDDSSLAKVNLHFSDDASDNSGDNGNSGTTDPAPSKPDNANSGTSTTPANKDNPDSGAPGIALALGTVALAGAAVVIYRKKR